MCAPFEVHLQVNENNRLHIKVNNSEFDLPITDGASLMPQPPNGTHGKMGQWFSPIEKSILKAATNNWQTAAELAEKTGQPGSSWFRAVLSNLVDREWLEGGRSGYRRCEGLDYRLAE